MKQTDLKKLALMGITGGILIISSSGDAAESYGNASNSSQNNDGKNDDYISQGYSNQGYFNNREGRESSSNYYYQVPKKRKGRSQDQDTDQNYDQSGSQGRTQNSNQGGNQDDGQKYQYRDRHYQDRNHVADNDKTVNDKIENTLDTEETPPDNIQDKPNVEEKFVSKLNPNEQSDYQELSAHGRLLARTMAAHECAGRNDCKGQNACKSDLNACAGRGSCKGKSICKVTASQAVKLSSVLDKRQNLKTNASSNSTIKTK